MCFAARGGTQFGASAMQGSLGAMGEMIGVAATPTDENCLTLNVWTRELTDEEYPVMVWIHGGGNVVGSSAQPRFDGPALRRELDCIRKQVPDDLLQAVRIAQDHSASIIDR